MRPAIPLNSALVALAALVTALATAGGCGDDGPTPLTPSCGAGGCPDLGPKPDSTSADGGADGASPADVGPPAKAAFGEPCTKNSGCVTGLCHQDAAGALCTLACTGSCPTGYQCDGVARVCLPVIVCEPSCVDKQCGTDGCGGSCGTCEAPAVCGPDAACVIDQVPFGAACTVDAQCPDGVCLPEAAGGRCSKPCDLVCPSGWECGDVAGASVCLPTPCEPDCTGRNCGDDGCGGSCGGCQGGTTCDAAVGLCVMLTCSDLPTAGCCTGNQLRNCIGGQIVVEDCSDKPFCGFNGIFGFYSCLTLGDNDPAGLKPKTCGYSALGGGKGCKEWALCVWDCPVGDTACRGNCDETTTAEALVDASLLLKCDKQQQCLFDDACLKANCMFDYNICMGD